MDVIQCHTQISKIEVGFNIFSIGISQDSY
jgi:hypothetical protein